MADTTQKEKSWSEKFDRLRTELGRDWLSYTRESAMARFGAMGFPSPTHEEWRFTNVAPITRIPFEPADSSEARVTPADLAPFLFDPEQCHLLVFVNGRHTPKLSTAQGLPNGVRVMNLAEAMRTEHITVEAHLARHANYQEQAFIALNTAFIRDGAFVHIPKGTIVEKPIHLLFVTRTDDRAIVTHPRTLIVAGENSQVTLVESYAGLGGGPSFTNAVTEIVAGENAVIDHYKVEREPDPVFHITARQIRQARSSNVSSHTLSFGGGLVRNDINTLLGGEGCNCMLNGLYVLNDSQHVDNHLRVDHASPHCNSWEYFKGILNDRSHGVFTGRIIVREDAQKTDAKQSNMNLLLSESATVNTKPQLEILADDVKCTHGATIGQIDENAVFYLRSRGVSEEAARSLLIYAFAGESIGQIRLAPLREQLQDLLSTRLPHGDTLSFGRPFEYSDDFSEIVRSADRRRET